jgi:hypothetical protein
VLGSTLERKEKSSHNDIDSFKQRGEVSDAGEQALMRESYVDDRPGDK